ncbi:MAG: PIN domain-containing protein [Nanoarchaeota archaeon]
MVRYFFDSYAIMEIIEGNSNYEIYLDSEIVINNFNFAELCYGWFRNKEKNVEIYIKKYSEHIVSVNLDWIEEAMKFRIDWKDRKVSVPDCIGYIMAKKLGILFLTGDKEFKDLDNVEFVK